MKTCISKSLFSFLLFCLSISSSGNLISQTLYQTKYNIDVANFFFNSSIMNINLYDTVRFRWVAGSHTTTCSPTILPGTSHPAGADDWDSPINSGSQFFSYVVKFTGSYVYGCQPHWPTMQGVLNVGNGYRMWSGAGDGSSWSDANNWVGGTVPLATDSVLLDNARFLSSYTVNLPGGAVNTVVRKCIINPLGGNIISLVLPSSNTSNPGFTVGDNIASNPDLVIYANGIFKNSSGAAAGNGLNFTNTNDSVNILNGGKYIHNTTRGNAGIMQRLSTASGNELGLVVFDVPTTSVYSISASGRVYPSITFSAASSGGTKVYARTGASNFTVRGNYKIETNAIDSSFMSSASSWTIGGDFTLNGATLIKNGQRISFIGTGTQNIYCDTSVYFPNQLIINANLIVFDKIIICDTLVLQNGVMKTFTAFDYNKRLTIGTSVSNAGAVIRTGGYVSACVERYIPASTFSAPLLFPTGYYMDPVLMNFYKPFTLACPAFAPSTSGKFAVQCFYESVIADEGETGGFDIPAYVDWGYTINRCALMRWGTNITGVTGGKFDLSADAYGTNGISDPVNLRLINRDPIVSLFYYPGIHSPGSGTTAFRTSVPLDSIGVIYIAGAYGSNPLPVALNSFTSITIKNGVMLNWKTAREQNNSSFDIERKSMNAVWYKVGNVTGNGNSNVIKNYSYEDRNLSTGKYNYRLKQIDYNGNSKYYELSYEVVIGVPGKFSLEQNYPNPFNPNTVISYQLPVAGFVTLSIFDINGKLVTQLVNEVKEAGYYSVKFDAAKLSSGIYFYKIKAGDFVSAKKMMLAK